MWEKVDNDQAVSGARLWGTLSQPGIVRPQLLIINLNEEQALPCLDSTGKNGLYQKPTFHI